MSDSTNAPNSTNPAWKKRFRNLFFGLITVILCGYIAFKVSPWPSALLIRYMFEKGAQTTSEKLEKHLPSNVTVVLNEPYGPNDPVAKLDVYYPAGTDSALTTVVWTHGGGWISGSKEEVGNYCKILASKGFAVVSIDYTIAPEAQHPTPVRQLNAALGYLKQHAGRLKINPKKFVLAGDSAGSQIAAEYAVCVGDPTVAKALGVMPAVDTSELKGMLLYCGPYDVRSVNFTGSFGLFLTTAAWSYAGTKDFLKDPLFDYASVVDHVPASFPKTFISVGNADPLESHSKTLTRKLTALGVPVDSLFFPKDHQPALGHEYQFDLDGEAGKLALERSVVFLKGLR